jgi:hypothetical protein
LSGSRTNLAFEHLHLDFELVLRCAGRSSAYGSYIEAEPTIHLLGPLKRSIRVKPKCEIVGEWLPTLDRDVTFVVRNTKMGLKI